MRRPLVRETLPIRESHSTSLMSDSACSRHLRTTGSDALLRYAESPLAIVQRRIILVTRPGAHFPDEHDVTLQKSGARTAAIRR